MRYKNTLEQQIQNPAFEAHRIPRRIQKPTCWLWSWDGEADPSPSTQTSGCGRWRGTCERNDILTFLVGWWRMDMDFGIKWSFCVTLSKRQPVWVMVQLWWSGGAALMCESVEDTLRPAKCTIVAGQVPVAHICNPSYLGVWDWEDCTLRLAWTYSSRDSISKITRAKWTGGVTQAVEHLLCKQEALVAK
jgi:hypothetical protein